MPWRPLRVGSTQSNMSMPRATACKHVVRRADAHQIARPLRRQHAARSPRRSRASPPAARRPRARRWRSRRSRCRPAPRALCSRNAAIVAALHDAEQRMRRAARASNARLRALGPAQRQLHRALDLLARRPAGRRHSSSCMEMSAPSSAWISIARSGVSSTMAPSRCERKVTPCSSSRAQLDERHHLEAAGIGEDRPRPVHEACRPPSAAMRSAPGRSIR